MIQFNRLAGVILEDQLMELRHLVSNHSLQHHKLVTVGSYLRNLFEEMQTMRANAERLTNRVDEVLTNTVQFVTDGDNFLSTIGRMLDNPITNAVDRGDGG